MIHAPVMHQEFSLIFPILIFSQTKFNLCAYTKNEKWDRKNKSPLFLSSPFLIIIAVFFSVSTLFQSSGQINTIDFNE